jgi:hypothetical protein
MREITVVYLTMPVSRRAVELFEACGGGVLLEKYEKTLFDAENRKSNAIARILRVR